MIEGEDEKEANKASWLSKLLLTYYKKRMWIAILFLFIFS
jgi:hypothetical protein